MGNLVILFLLISSFPTSTLSWWPFSSSSSPSFKGSAPPKRLHGGKFEFLDKTEKPEDGLVDIVQRKSSAPYTCWHGAYQNLSVGCSEIMAGDEMHKRLAWLVSDCFQRESGKPAFPNCPSAAPMQACLRKLSDAEHHVYLEHYLATNSICFQLQTQTFKHETERLVNDLAKSALFTEEKLEIIEEKSDQLLQYSDKIHDTLDSVDIQTQQVAQASRDTEVKIHDVLKHSEAISEQSKGIAASQSQIKDAQVEMRDVINSGMARLQETYENLGEGMENLRRETSEIEKEVKVVGDSMVSRMQGLESTADALTKFQYEALEESRNTLNKISEFGHKQQEELMERKEQIQQAHNLLFENSQAILAAQEKFEVKQANIFASLDKLFALLNVILVESRFMKSLFFYAFVIFILYMLTSAKQTFGIRARLYFGLCVTLVVELMIIRLGADDFNQQTWIMSKVFLARSSFLIAASIQILHSIFTYRDYEMLNHQLLMLNNQLLQTLAEKVYMLERNSGKRYLSLSMDSDDESLSNYSWIDEELPEDVDINEDPNYFLEEVAENFAAPATRKYDLRSRSRN